MIAGIADKTKNLTFLEPYWSVLKTWADYIVASLPDPGDQLCTDDFEGKSPHNINLAAKVKLMILLTYFLYHFRV